MTTTTPSKGTHFSDGVRVGPILGSTYATGANVLTPSQMVSSPIDQAAPGIFDTPMSLLDIAPVPNDYEGLAYGYTFPAAGYAPLRNTVADNRAGFNIITYQGVPNVIMLDVARCVSISQASGVVGPIITFFGWDEYGVPMAENLIPSLDGSPVYGNKAFKYIRAIYSSSNTTGPLEFGTGSTFGLPYLLTSPNYVFAPMWNGIMDSGSIVIGNNTSKLANNAGSSVAGSSLVTFALTGSNPLLDASEFMEGEWVTLDNVNEFGGLLHSELNREHQIVSVDAVNNTLTVELLMKSNTSTSGGGGNMTLTYGPCIATGDVRAATATTGDVRGTYKPFSDPDGFKRLTLNMYNASGDARKYNNALSPTSTYMLRNQMVANNGDSVVYVHLADHQLTNGELVTISGANAFCGLSAAALNITAPVTVVNPNAFSYVANGTATSSGVLLDDNVVITPGKGNLYQTTIGRYGVPQYNLSPMP